jgi:hypothetical protein
VRRSAAGGMRAMRQTYASAGRANSLTTNYGFQIIPMAHNTYESRRVRPFCPFA